MAEIGYPILEFDRDPNAKINPEMMAEGQFSTDKLVITFFPEVMEQLKAEGKIRLEQTISGENPILVYRFTDADVLILLGAIGCPACAGTLDQLHAMGIQKVMFCGGGGVLDPDIEVGQLLLVILLLAVLAHEEDGALTVVKVIHIQCVGKKGGFAGVHMGQDADDQLFHGEITSKGWVDAPYYTKKRGEKIVSPRRGRGGLGWHPGGLATPAGVLCRR